MSIDLRKRMAELEDNLKPAAGPLGWHKKSKVTPEMENEMQRLRALEQTYQEIGKQLGVSWGTVRLHIDPEAREGSNKAVLKYRKAYPERVTETVKRYREEYPERVVETRRKHREEYPERVVECTRKYVHKRRLAVIALLDGKCLRCGESDWRVLEVNHIEGGGRADRKKYGGHTGLYQAIRGGERSTGDLTLLCSNCNILYEFEQGRRKTASPEAKMRSAAVKMLGEKCAKCGSEDLRILVINHLKGGGGKEVKMRGNYHFYQSITSGERATDDLNVLCMNDNILYEYETGRRREQ